MCIDFVLYDEGNFLQTLFSGCGHYSWLIYALHKQILIRSYITNTDTYQISMIYKYNLARKLNIASSKSIAKIIVLLF